MALAGDIEAVDYNTIRSKIIEVMGTGLGTFGYGQSLVSSAVASGNTITAEQWTNLRFDIINALIHQTGNTPSAVSITAGDVIDDRASDPVVNYNTLTNQARANRFDLAPTQSLFSAVDEKTYSSTWSTLAELTCTMTFASASDARYFFNSGGNLQITTTRTGGDATLQNQSWTDLLTEVGTQTVRATVEEDVNNFYTLTNNYQTIYELSSSAPYADNTYRISAKCDVADNTTGTATEVDIKVELIDSYIDPDVIAGFSGTYNPPTDVIDGTLTITIVEQKASGVLQPSPATGNFAITSPSYTVSNISVS